MMYYRVTTKFYDDGKVDVLVDTVYKKEQPKNKRKPHSPRRRRLIYYTCHITTTSGLQKTLTAAFKYDG